MAVLELRIAERLVIRWPLIAIASAPASHSPSVSSARSESRTFSPDGASSTVTCTPGPVTAPKPVSAASRVRRSAVVLGGRVGLVEALLETDVELAQAQDLLLEVGDVGAAGLDLADEGLPAGALDPRPGRGLHPGDRDQQAEDADDDSGGATLPARPGLDPTGGAPARRPTAGSPRRATPG